ncbi:MAG TPA: hypothetical protein VFC16_13805 [Nakamurella sp.]|nr:hypothetical protein [Nakamurella sp.]
MQALTVRADNAAAVVELADGSGQRTLDSRWYREIGCRYVEPSSSRRISTHGFDDEAERGAWPAGSAGDLGVVTA